MNKEKPKTKFQFSIKKNCSVFPPLCFNKKFMSFAHKTQFCFGNFLVQGLCKRNDFNIFSHFNGVQQVKVFRDQVRFDFQGGQTFSSEKTHWGIFSSKKEKIQKSTKYILQKYQRSNQDTLIFQRPLVHEGEWIQSGDILADCSTSLGGELCLGKNIFIAYMPWEGYNYEDAILISQRLVTEDVYTSIHIESYEVETRSTKLGKEQITRKIPEISESQISHLDERGIVKRGTSVKEGDILVGKVTPIQKKFVSAYEKLLYTILEKELIPMRDTSLRTPKGLKAKVLEVKIFQFSNEKTQPFSKNKNFSSLQSFFDKPFSKKKKYQELGFLNTIIFKNPFLKKKSLLLPLQPQQNPIFGGKKDIDSFVFESAHFFLRPLRGCKKKNLQKKAADENVYAFSGNKNLQQTKFDNFSADNKKNGSFKNNLKYIKKNKKNLSFFMPSFSTNKKILKKKQHLFSVFQTEKNKKVFSQNASTAGINFIQNLKQQASHTMVQEQGQSTFLTTQYEKKIFHLQKGKFPKTKKIQLNHFRWDQRYASSQVPEKNFRLLPFFAEQKKGKPEKVQIYLVEKRKIQVGDKMSGRHGNKGIVSQILPIPDMPFLPDGTPLDMVLNPLGVPSRMNVGQIYECILGLASKYLQQYYRIQPFDEIYGPQASRSFTFSKLYEARQKTSQKWLFNPCYPGKIQIFDGRTGEPYENPVTVGISYILKLVHLVDDKIHARSTGPYSLVTQQPLKGRSKYGGQRLGEMEVWAIEAYGAAFVLLEMLTIKSDDISGRMTLWSNILLNMPIYIGTPESFKVLVCELQALCLDMGLYKLNKKGFLTQIEHLMQLP